MNSKLTLAAACAALALSASIAHAVALDILYVAGNTTAGTNNTAYQTFATSGQFSGSTWTVKGSGLTGNDLIGGDLDRTATFGGVSQTVKSYLQSFDLVIVATPVTSGNYVDGVLGADWAGINVPILFNSALASRASGGRIGLTSGDNAQTGFNFSSANETTKVSNTTLGNAIFSGTTDPTNLYSLTNGDVILNAATVGTGEVISTIAGTNALTPFTAGTAYSIVYWNTGTTDSIGRTLANDRALFALKGGYSDLNADGQIVLGNIINQLTAIPEPSSFAALAGLAALGLVATRRRAAR